MRRDKEPRHLPEIELMPDEEFEITSIHHLRQGTIYALLKAAKMTYAQGAEALGMTEHDFGDMVRLKRLPSFEGRKGEQLAESLYNLTGKTVQQLFPQYIRTKEFLSRKKTVVVTRTVSTKLLASTSMVRSLSQTGEGAITRSADKVAYATEVLSEVLSNLSIKEGQEVRAALYKKWSGQKGKVQQKPHGMVISIP